MTTHPPPVLAPSLGQLVAWWIECYDSGVYTYDEDRGWIGYRSDVPSPGPANWYVCR